MIQINGKDYLTPKETTAFLNISVLTLWNWVKKGKLHKFSISTKKIYFKKEEVEGLLK
jgi:predicted site-specific integrase-resolvase